MTTQSSEGKRHSALAVVSAIAWSPRAHRGRRGGRARICSSVPPPQARLVSSTKYRSRCGIDPERRAGEADVAERRARHPRAARRSRQHRIPAERARAAGNRVLVVKRPTSSGVHGGEPRPHRRARLAAPSARMRRRRRRAEQPGVTGDAAERRGVVVVDLADAAAVLAARPRPSAASAPHRRSRSESETQVR